MKKIIPLISAIFLSSCMATQKDMLILQSQIDDLNTNIYTLKKNQADLSIKIDELNRNLTAFSENTKDLNVEMGKLSSKIDDIQSTTDRKITQIGKAVTQRSESETDYLKETSLFYRALSLYSSQKYEQAVDVFKDYILKFPKGENLDQAYFYIAQSLFELKNYKDAAIFYARIIASYPKFSKTAYVRLNYSRALIELKDKTKTDEAVTYLKSIEKEFPNTDEALIAKHILEEMAPKKTAVSKKNHKN